jgi:hypothetical protein
MKFDIVYELSTLMRYLLHTGELNNIEKAIDILSVVKILNLDFKMLKRWKIQTLIGLRRYYMANKKYS